MTIEKSKRRPRRFVFSRAFLAELADLDPAELEKWISHLPIGFFYELAAAIDTRREIAQRQAASMIGRAGLTLPRPIHRPRRSPAD